MERKEKWKMEEKYEETKMILLEIEGIWERMMAINILLKTGCKQTSKRKTANDGNARMRKQSRGEIIALILSSRWWKSNDSNMLYQCYGCMEQFNITASVKTCILKKIWHYLEIKRNTKGHEENVSKHLNSRNSMNLQKF